MIESGAPSLAQSVGQRRSEFLCATTRVQALTIYESIGGRVQPAVAYSPHDPSEIAKTIAFDQTVGEGKWGSDEFALPSFAAVADVDLDSVKYPDGSSCILLVVNRVELSVICECCGGRFPHLHLDEAANRQSTCGCERVPRPGVAIWPPPPRLIRTKHAETLG